MNDRYLFRGKRMYNDGWVQGCLNTWEEVGGRILAEIKAEYVNPPTIGQCTGLCDKNGNLIFEGDIFKQNNGVVCAVEWLNDSWNAYYRPLILHVGDGVEIIGNIHDNPELLKTAHA